MDAGRITGFGRAEDLPEALRAARIDTGDPTLRDAAIMPGLVNAHTHLELSWMRGLVARGTSMPAWASELIALRRGSAVDPAPAILDAIAEAVTSGTSLVGDVANTDATIEPLERKSARGGGLPRADWLSRHRRRAGRRRSRGRACPRAVARPVHARAARAVLRVAGAAGRARPPRTDIPLSIHLGESTAELEFLRRGADRGAQLLEAVGAWNPTWRPPACRPVEYLDGLGLLTPRLLAVHGVHLPAIELDRLAAAGATLVTCPRSNAWTGAGIPPIERFYASGVRVAIGTDSLASVGHPEPVRRDGRRAARGAGRARGPYPAERDARRRRGAGLRAELGVHRAGKRAALLAVRVPPGLADVEEYLVGGVRPRDVRWLA